MSMYKYISKTWQDLWKSNAKELREKAIMLRREPTIIRIERPSRLDKARMLGYKAKQGFVVVRIKVGRGGMRKQRPRSGRRPKHLGVTKIKQSISMQKVAERRVKERYPNLDVIGSYYLYKDAIHYWYEVLLVDRNHPAVYKDKEMRHRLGLIQTRC